MTARPTEAVGGPEQHRSFLLTVHPADRDAFGLSLTETFGGRAHEPDAPRLTTTPAQTTIGTLTREVGDGAGQLAHGARHRDAEHTLAALEQIHDLFSRSALVDRGAVGEQGDVGEVLHTALTQVVDRDPNVVQRDARVEQPLDDLEDQHILERVQPLAA